MSKIGVLGGGISGLTFARLYNNWRKQEILGWRAPAEVYHNPKYFNKGALQSKTGQNFR
jgi:hypothetical protein